jgi:hypothetical protein
MWNSGGLATKWIPVLNAAETHHEIPRNLLARQCFEESGLTLELTIPLAPSELCSCSPSISLGPVTIQLGTSTAQPSISGVFTKDSMIGSLDSQLTTGDQEMLESG